MKPKMLFVVGCCVIGLLTSCQNAMLPMTDGSKSGEQIVMLVDSKAGARSGFLNGVNGAATGQAEAPLPPSAVSSLAAALPGSCVVHTESNRTVYAGPGTGYPIVGRLDPGRDYQVMGMYASDNFPTWWRIDYWGSEGWINGYGASTNFTSRADCNPAVALIDIDPPPTAPSACTFHSEEERAIYAGPGTGYSIVDQIEPGHTYLVTGMYYDANYPTWWQLDYDGTQGWISASDGYSNFMPGASCSPPVDLISITPPPPTAVPSPTAIPGACTFHSEEERTAYAGPGINYPVVGSIEPGRVYLVTGMYYSADYPTWWRLDYGGSEGWAEGLHAYTNFMPGTLCNPSVDLVDITPAPSVTPTPPPVPSSAVIVSYAEIFPGGSDMSRNHPLDFAIKTDFNNAAQVNLSLKGFFTYQGQAVPDDAACGQSEATGFAWAPAPSAFELGQHSLTDWGHIAVEAIPADAAYLTAVFTIGIQPDNAIEYCIQKTYALTDEPAVPPPPDDPSAIKVANVTFWPDVAVVDRASSFDFGARLDFESIIMTQARLLAFFTYQGQDIPGESVCMSGQMSGQSGEVFWSTGSSTRMSTGSNHFEQPYTYSGDAPDDATHLVLWLLLEGVSGKPVMCWQKVIGLSTADQ